MKNSEYTVMLNTPIGNRFGKFIVRRDGSRIWGILSILNHSLPFEGKINKNGECTIKGTFITLIRTVFYKAKGLITESSVQLELKDGKNTYFLTGNVYNERKPYEKVLFKGC